MLVTSHRLTLVMVKKIYHKMRVVLKAQFPRKMLLAVAPVTTK